MLVRTLLAALVGGAALDRLNVPAGALIGAMVGVGAMNLIGQSAVGPGNVLRFAAFVIIGWELGSQIDRSTLDTVRGALMPLLVVVGGLLLAGILLVLILVRAGFDPVTSFLAASPGGLAHMGALSAEFRGNAVVVVLVHLVRLVTVILVVPLILRFVE
ncbi:MAG TPA: AbrB family transcriptional regulator [Acidimicrobiia bacterium]|nr:AbrB family transcriptional regulator [Acidimicrobiia bacterium]